MLSKKTKEKVKTLLETYSELRDDDVRLMCNIWIDDLHPRNINDMTACELLCRLKDGELTHFESIRRFRQKLQEELVYLRGKKYDERHKRQSKVKHDLRETAIDYLAP